MLRVCDLCDLRDLMTFVMYVINGIYLIHVIFVRFASCHLCARYDLFGPCHPYGLQQLSDLGDPGNLDPPGILILNPFSAPRSPRPIQNLRVPFSALHSPFFALAFPLGSREFFKPNVVSE